MEVHQQDAISSEEAPSQLTQDFAKQGSRHWATAQVTLWSRNLFGSPELAKFLCEDWRAPQLQQKLCCQREGGGQGDWLSACDNAFGCPQHPKRSPGRADISCGSCQNIPTQIWKTEPLQSSLQLLLWQNERATVKISPAP